MDAGVTQLAREVEEALERDGYEVERVKPMAALPAETEHGHRGLIGRGHALAARVVRKVGDGEFTQESIDAALVKAREVIRRRRAAGVRQAQEIDAIFIWTPGEQGWGLAKYERVDD